MLVVRTKYTPFTAHRSRIKSPLRLVTTPNTSNRPLAHLLSHPASHPGLTIFFFGSTIW